MLRSIHRSAARRAAHGRDRGLSLVLAGLLLVSMLGAASLVVDLGVWQVQASKLQKAADAAALAAVVRLPDGDSAATTRAVDVAAANGFTDGVDGASVTVTILDSEEIAVSITKDDIPQFFASVFRDAPTITRRSTAQYVQPVPLGSPRNYLGTGDLLSGVVTGDGVEGFWLAASGPCTRREYGDRIATRAMAIPNTAPYDCSTSGGGRRPNPEYDPNGYLFGVTVPEASGTNQITIQMFDAPVCAGNSPIAGDENNAPFDVRVRVRRGDDLDPLAGTVLTDQTFIGRNTATGPCLQGPAGLECVSSLALASCWTDLATVNAPGDYFVQVETLFTNVNVDSRHDNFSLRAKEGALFTPCTSDPAQDGVLGASPAYTTTCPQVYGFEHLPVFANLGGTDPVFFLSSVDSRHNGKTMQVTLYDAAEGGSGIQLLDPTGTPAEFTWEVLCADATEGNPSCPGESNPTGGRTGPASGTTLIDVSGTGTKTFPNNTQNGKYSDRLLRLSVELPDDITAAHGTDTWWKIRYTGSFSGDRTTWSVRLLGDPVRLLPNS